MASSSAADTSEHVPGVGPAQSAGRHGSASAEVDTAGLSHRGLVRENNEDHFLITRFGRFLEALATNIPPEELPPHHELTGHALLVADGLGGHAAGEAASKSAIRIMCELVLETPDWIFSASKDTLTVEVVERATKRFKNISRTMTKEAEANPVLRDFGTTLTVAWGISRDWFVAHIGDSRAYLFRAGELHQLTRDHTVAQALADAGLIEQQEVAVHRWRNRLTQLLGDQDFPVKPEIKQLSLENDDCLLLCSDGLPDMLTDEKIAEILGAGRPAEATCRALVDEALAAGGEDNVTVAVARVRLAG
jgi:serine/threonine protein phosphatase PrpC